MNPNEFLTHIRAQIARDELAQALRQLQQFLAQAPQLDERLQQSGRFAAILQQIRLGTVSQADATLTQNQIRDALLELLSEIDAQQAQSAALGAEMAQAIVGSKNTVANTTITAEGDVHIGFKASPPPIHLQRSKRAGPRHGANTALCPYCGRAL